MASVGVSKITVWSISPLPLVFSLPGHMTSAVKAGWSCPHAARLVQLGAKRAESSETSQQCVNNTDRPHHCVTLSQRCGKHSHPGTPLRRNATAFCGMLCVSASFFGGGVKREMLSWPPLLYKQTQFHKNVSKNVF